MRWRGRLTWRRAVVGGAGAGVPEGGGAWWRLRPDMNLWRTVAVVGALAIDEFFEAATVAFLFALSLSLESWSVGRARRAIATLMSLSPQTARILRADGSEEVVDVREVPVGSTIIARPGDKFPLDLSGKSGFDNSANTLFIQPLLMERYIGAADDVV